MPWTPPLAFLDHTKRMQKRWLKRLDHARSQPAPDLTQRFWTTRNYGFSFLLAFYDNGTFLLSSYELETPHIVNLHKGKYSQIGCELKMDFADNPYPDFCNPDTHSAIVNMWPDSLWFVVDPDDKYSFATAPDTHDTLLYDNQRRFEAHQRAKAAALNHNSR